MADSDVTGDHRNERRGRRGSYRAGFFFGTLSFGAAIGIGFVSTILTARLYGVSVIGDYALVWAPVAALWVLSTIKEQQALIKEITGLSPRHPRVTQLFAAVFTFSAGLTIAMALVDSVVCWFVFPGPLHAPELLAPALASIAGYTLVTNTGWNLDSILSAFLAGRQLFRVRLNESLSFIVLVTAAGLTWKSVWGLVAATIGASLIALVHRVIAVRPFVRGRLDLAEFREGLRVLPGLLRFGLKATPGQVAIGVSQQGGVWAIGMVAPVAVVGAYSRALVIPKSVQQASMRITEVLFPTLVGRHTKGDGHGFDRALIDSIRYEVFGMLLLAAAVGGAASSVLQLFGPGFDRAAPALALLVLYPVLASATVTQTQALWAVDRPGLTSIISLVRLAVTIALLVVLTPTMNMVGPALALLAGLLVVLVFSGLALRRHLARPLRATWPLRERLVLLLAYGAGFGAAHLVERAMPSIAALPLCLAAGSLAYAAVLGALGLNRRDRERFGELATRLRRRLAQRRRGRPSFGAAAPLLVLLVALATLPAHAGAFVYWTDGVPGGSLGRAGLDGTPAPGGDWLPGTGEGCGVAVDGSHVYWTTRGGTIGRANLDGSAADPSFIVLPAGWACGVTADSSHLYWASNSSGKLGRANLDGSGAEASWMTPGSGHGCGIAVDATSVYWATAAGVYSAPLSGGPPSAISEATNNNCGVAVNAAHVYWATGEGYIERDPLSGGPPTPIVKAPLAPCGVAVDVNYVYWGNSGSDTVGRANLDGSGLEQRFAAGARHPCGVAVDALGPPPAGKAEERRAKPKPSNSFWLGRAWRNRLRGTAWLEAFVPGPGSLVVTGKRVVRRSVGATGPAPGSTPGKSGGVEIPIVPKRSTRSILRRTGRAVVGVSVVYTPAGGDPSARSTRVRLAMKLRRRGAGSAALSSWPNLRPSEVDLVGGGT
jgi:O-antigen/teichoic acid export membrane protein